MGDYQVIEAGLLRHTAQTINCLKVQLITFRIVISIYTITEVSVQFHTSFTGL
jgi:hypothetical protein